MAVEKGVVERLQPSLLDRLTDDNPGDRGETRESRVIDVRRLREIVLRDLSWLFNTTCFQTVKEIDHLPHAIRSTLNYGVPDIAGTGAGTQRAVDLRRQLRTAVEVFEPRIIPGSLQISLSEGTETSAAQIVLDIRGELWAQPLPIELYMRTEVDVTTGSLHVVSQN